MQHALDVLERIELSNFLMKFMILKWQIIYQSQLAPYEQMIEQFDIETKVPQCLMI